MAKVTHFKLNGFFTVETWIMHPRYFNGRKYIIDKYLTHYVKPNAHAKNFTDVVNSTVLYNGNDYVSLRCSRFTFTAREQLTAREQMKK